MVKVKKGSKIFNGYGDYDIRYYFLENGNYYKLSNDHNYNYICSCGHKEVTKLDQYCPDCSEFIDWTIPKKILVTKAEFERYALGYEGCECRGMKYIHVDVIDCPICGNRIKDFNKVFQDDSDVMFKAEATCTCGEELSVDSIFLDGYTTLCHCTRTIGAFYEKRSNYLSNGITINFIDITIDSIVNTYWSEYIQFINKIAVDEIKKTIDDIRNNVIANTYWFSGNHNIGKTGFANIFLREFIDMGKRIKAISLYDLDSKLTNFSQKQLIQSELESADVILIDGIASGTLSKNPVAEIISLADRGKILIITSLQDIDKVPVLFSKLRNNAVNIKLFGGK